MTAPLYRRPRAYRFRTIPKNSTTARGYGADHRAARKAAAAQHSPSDPCARCGQPLGPMGPWLHYDHNASRTGYLGFAHARCNRTAGAREGNVRQRQQRRGFRTSYDW